MANPTPSPTLPILPSPTKKLGERLDRLELESSIANYLVNYIGMTEDGAKNFAESTIDSWHLFLKKGDTPNGRK